MSHLCFTDDITADLERDFAFIEMEAEANATSSPTTCLLAPKSLLKDRWEVLRKIGGGGFGEIYKAKDHLTNTVIYIFLSQLCTNSKIL